MYHAHHVHVGYEAQMGQWSDNAAAGTVAPSPFSPDMGALLQNLPAPTAQHSFGFAGGTGTVHAPPSVCEFHKTVHKCLRAGVSRVF